MRNLINKRHKEYFVSPKIFLDAWGRFTTARCNKFGIWIWYHQTYNSYERRLSSSAIQKEHSRALLRRIL